MNRNTAALLAGAAVLAAAVIGGQNGPQRPRTALWYARLRKPAYTPPGPAIGATWGVLETLLAATGYRLLRQPPTQTRSAALASWGCSLLGLAGFPALFFGRKRLGLSTAASGAMLAATAGTALLARDIDRPAAVLSLPLLGWLGFATVLSGDLYRRNR
jgi:tryptophan-rich sensory protein